MSGPASAGTADVLVVGGGVVGLAIAERLACEGVSVRVLEAERIGSGASGAAAGMLAPLGEGRVDAEDPGTRALLSLGMASLLRFEGLCARLKAETGIDPEFERSGLIELAPDAASRALLERKRNTFGTAVAVAPEAPDSTLVSRPGSALDSTLVSRSDSPWAFDPELEWLDRAALREIEPTLEPSIEAALYSPHESHLRPPLLVRALEASARAHGAKIETGVRVLRLRRDERRIVGVDSSAGEIFARQVVVAAGPWTPALLEASDLGRPGWTRLPIEPVRGQILQLESPLPGVREICWAPGIYCVPKRDGTWVVGATEEAVGFDRRVTADGVADLLERARAIFPTLAEASFGRAWAGLRPVSQDGRPFIGPLPEWDGLQLAAGHGRNGILLSPITAELVADAILGKGAIEDTHPVSPARLLRGFSSSA